MVSTMTSRPVSDDDFVAGSSPFRTSHKVQRWGDHSTTRSLTAMHSLFTFMISVVETAIRPQPNIIDLTSPKPIRSSWIDPFSIASSFASGLKPNSQVKSKVNLDEEGEEEDIKPDIPLIPKEPNELIDLTLSDVEDKGNKVGTVRDGDKEHGGSGDGKYEHESPAVTEKIIEFGVSHLVTTITTGWNDFKFRHLSRFG